MSKKSEATVTVANPIDAIVSCATMSKSGKIRALTELGFDRSQVASMLEIRYQHVRNVLITPIKKS